MKTIYLPPDFDPSTIMQTMEAAKMGFYDEEKPGYKPAYCDDELNVAVQLLPGLEISDELKEEIQDVIDVVLEEGDGGYGVVGRNDNEEHQEMVNTMKEKMGIEGDIPVRKQLSPEELPPPGEEYNGVEGDACPCISCHERRKNIGPDATFDASRPPSDPYHQHSVTELKGNKKKAVLDFLDKLEDAIIDKLPPEERRAAKIKNSFIKDPKVAERLYDLGVELDKLTKEVSGRKDKTGQTLVMIPEVMRLTHEVIQLMSDRMLHLAELIGIEAKKANLGQKDNEEVPENIKEWANEMMILSHKLGIGGFLKTEES